MVVVVVARAGALVNGRSTTLSVAARGALARAGSGVRLHPKGRARRRRALRCPLAVAVRQPAGTFRSTLARGALARWSRLTSPGKVALGQPKSIGAVSDARQRVAVTGRCADRSLPGGRTTTRPDNQAARARRADPNRASSSPRPAPTSHSKHNATAASLGAHEGWPTAGRGHGRRGRGPSRCGRARYRRNPAAARRRSWNPLNRRRRRLSSRARGPAQNGFRLYRPRAEQVPGDPLGPS